MENVEWILLHATDQQEQVEQKLLPQLTGFNVTLRSWEPGQSLTLPESTRVLVWLDDAAMRHLVPMAAEQQWFLGVLPHPDMPLVMRSLQMQADVATAIQMLKDDTGGQQMDLLYCNEQPVFNAVSIGDPFGLRAARQGEGFLVRWQRFVRLVRSLNTVRLRAFTLTTGKERVVETAALGMVAVDRGDASRFTRRVVDEAEADDQLLSLLILSPRSVMEALRFLLSSLLLRFVSLNRLPVYLGLIKSNTVLIESPSPVVCMIDGQRCKLQSIHLRVEPAALQLLGQPQLEGKTVSGGAPPKEVFRAQGLPTGEARRELLAYPLPWIHHAATEEFKDLFLILKENARPTEAYLTLMVLSTLLALTGLFANSAPVIIGAMILAPLMAPIISLSMGVLRQHQQLVLDSGRSLLMGIGLALTCATLMTWITPLQTINDQIAARLSPTLLDLGVAIISGIAGAYAHARAEVAKSLAGVAIAVALVPPLAVAGIGIGWFDWGVFQGAFLLFLTNLFGIVLAAALTFMVLGFSPFRLARKGLILSLLVVVLVSIPLAVSFSGMVTESRIIRQLEGQILEGVELREVRVRRGPELQLSLKLMSDQLLSIEQIDEIKQQLEQQLGQPLQLEAMPVLVR